ncbi:DUF3592 domain-containing protein [Aestuariibaculum sp. YM273]|uniref:DUF3592 domain-containing protein n=1 Tax=Aestuariibaculum sp. YM273 TaxID=3070659 RepID=UPI0027DE8F80|nr:DUF3592 domain-containing protein [Aestuariibaculum sp. YM273]WMI64796.1 DUF3592 domain-containing protein [Aestuariibaculum sp. YM273]
MENLIGAIVFLIVGGGFLYAGFYVRNSNRRIQTSGIKTRAKIIDFIEERSKDADGDSQIYHFPVVRFTDKNGIETTQKLDSSANPKRINQPIDIIYLKKDNEYEIIINSEFWKTYFPMIFIVSGFLFSGIGIVWLINKI